MLHAVARAREEAMSALQIWECDHCHKRSEPSIKLPEGWEWFTITNYSGRNLYGNSHLCPGCLPITLVSEVLHAAV